MSFDLQFVYCGPGLAFDDELLKAGMNYKGRATEEEQSRIRQLAETLVDSFDGASWSEMSGGIAQGAWVESDELPEIDIGAKGAFLSSKPDPSDPETLDLFKKLLSVFESCGYVCFDLQRGAVVRASSFTFG